MRLLANENLPGEAVDALRERGHDVTWMRTDAPGSPDTEVLRMARDEGRVLMTFDKDFGELAFRSRLPATCGVVLFRIPMNSPAELARRVAAAMDSRSAWAGYFSVVEAGRVRQRPLPTV